MKTVKVSPAPPPLAGELSFPGDKSLSHRAVIFGALAKGDSRFTNVLAGEDCVCTRRAFEAMGVKIESSADGSELTVHGVGLKGLKAPKKELYLGNSGTSMRLLMGVLAGQGFSATLTGDPSLSSRPMRRVGDLLKRMGARIEGRENGNLAPLRVRGGRLKGVVAELPVASAQVKSALLLAGLYADGATVVTEPERSRDHTERFLEHFGAPPAEYGGKTTSVRGGETLTAKSFAIAGDISSAAFFMAAGALVPDSNIAFRSVLWNPTRIGIYHVLRRMNAKFAAPPAIRPEGPETVADFQIESGPLSAFEITKAELPSLIDEIPILCVLATQAQGKSVIRDAKELRVKETDRIQSMVSQLSKMGANIRAEGDSIHIEGPVKLKGAVVNSFKDHRTAMSLIVAGLIAEGPTTVEDIECIDTSFPTFFELLKRIGGRFEIG